MHHVSGALDELEDPKVTVGEALSEREQQVLQLVAWGYVTDEIGKHLGVSPETVKTHVHHAMTKLRARTRAHAVALAAGRGEISLGAEPR